MCAQDAQKNDLKPHLKKQWVIPPEANAEFVCAMEDVQAGTDGRRIVAADLIFKRGRDQDIALQR